MISYTMNKLIKRDFFSIHTFFFFSPLIIPSEIKNMSEGKKNTHAQECMRAQTYNNNKKRGRGERKRKGKEDEQAIMCLTGSLLPPKISSAGAVRGGPHSPESPRRYH